jgi:hypothetical protein
MQLHQNLRLENPLDEEVIRTQEMSIGELELALRVTKRAQQRTSVLEPLLIPNELKHLSLLDWEIVGNLLETLEWESQRYQVH